MGATVIMIQCLYKNREFIRIGYYISHEYTEPLADGGLIEVVCKTIYVSLLRTRRRQPVSYRRLCERACTSIITPIPALSAYLLLLLQGKRFPSRSPWTS